MLTRLAEHDPPFAVPRLRDTHRFGELRCDYLEGISAIAAIEAGNAARVLGATG